MLPLALDATATTVTHGRHVMFILMRSAGIPRLLPHSLVTLLVTSVMTLSWRIINGIVVGYAIISRRRINTFGELSMGIALLREATMLFIWRYAEMSGVGATFTSGTANDGCAVCRHWQQRIR